MPHRTVSRSALAVGLCALIPLPWLDRAVSRAIMWGTLDLVSEQLHRPLDGPTLEVLTEDRSSMVLGCLVSAIVWPVRKLFRTVLYFLTVKDAVDWAIEAALRAEMVRVALETGALPGHAPEVRQLMDATLDRYRTSPLTRWALRMERPPVSWRHGGDALARVVGWLVMKGGGGVILPDFHQRLRSLPGRQTRELEGPVASAGEAVEV